MWTCAQGGNEARHYTQWTRLNQLAAVFVLATELGLFATGVRMLKLTYPGFGQICSSDLVLPMLAVISDPNSRITVTLVFTMITACFTAIHVCASTWWRNPNLGQVRARGGSAGGGAVPCALEVLSA